jgi:hypothetical protein
MMESKQERKRDSENTTGNNTYLDERDDNFCTTNIQE